MVVYPVGDEDDDDARWGGGVLEGEVEEPRVRVLDVGGTSGEFEVIDVGAIVGLRAERDEVDYESVVVFAEGAAEGAPHRGLVINHGVAVVEDNTDVHLRWTLKRGQGVSCICIYKELKRGQGVSCRVLTLPSSGWGLFWCTEGMGMLSGGCGGWSCWAK